MKISRIITILLLAFVVVSIIWLVFKPADSTKSEDQQQVKSQVIAYYFHGKVRCPSCIKIEQLSKETLENEFASELANKKLQFVTVDTGEPANAHFIQDYQLSANSLVLALFIDGKKIRWENLTEVWNLLDDGVGFKAYVRENTARFLRELSK